MDGPKIGRERDALEGGSQSRVLAWRDPTELLVVGDDPGHLMSRAGVRLPEDKAMDADDGDEGRHAQNGRSNRPSRATPCPRPARRAETGGPAGGGQRE